MHLVDEALFEENKAKACTILWRKCAQSMQTKLKARKGYKSLANGAIALKKAIREQALNYDESKCFMETIHSACPLIFGSGHN